MIRVASAGVLFGSTSLPVKSAECVERYRAATPTAPAAIAPAKTTAPQR